jgi:hypothetical protein
MLLTEKQLRLLAKDGGIVGATLQMHGSCWHLRFEILPPNATTPFANISKRLDWHRDGQTAS